MGLGKIANVGFIKLEANTMLSNRMVSLLIGVMVALAFLVHTPTAYRSLEDLYQRQVESNERFNHWRNAYEALLPITAQWEQTYPLAVSDLVELYQRVALERHGLKADVDSVMQTGTSLVTVRGFDVGLSSLCIGTNNSA